MDDLFTMTDDEKLFVDAQAGVQRDDRLVSLDQVRKTTAWARAITDISPFLRDVVWRLATEHIMSGHEGKIPAIYNAAGALCDAFERLA